MEPVKSKARHVGRAGAPLQGGGHDRLHLIGCSGTRPKGNGAKYQIPLGKTIAVAALLALSACTTTRGSFCDIAKPIRPANVDVLTDAEVADMLSHNRKGAALCGWKQ